MTRSDSPFPIAGRRPTGEASAQSALYRPANNLIEFAFASGHNRRALRPRIIVGHYDHKRTNMKAKLATGIVLFALAGSALAQVGYSEVGGSRYYDDGTSSSQVGDSTYYSDGESATRVGDSTYFSDGTSASRVGDSTYYSDGTTATRVGDSVYYSNGKSCTRVGESVYCN